MDKKDFEEAGINYNEGVERFVGSAQMYEMFLKKFLDDETFKALDEAMENGNVKEAFNAAHTLKGVTGNLSLNRLFEKLEPFVEVLRSENMEKAKADYPEIKKEYETVISFINTMD